MRTIILCAALAGLAACGPDRRQVDADMAAREAAIQAGAAAYVATREALPVPNAPQATPAGPPPGMQPVPMSRLIVSCDNGETRELRFFPEQGVAVLVVDGATTELQMEPAASGIRYAGFGTEVRGKGSDYTIAREGEPTLTCVAQA